METTAAPWKKSSHSAGDGNCVEITGWHKSLYSGGVNSECVEVGGAPGLVGVRDTKNREQGHLTLSRGAWRAFLAAVTADTQY